MNDALTCPHCECKGRVFKTRQARDGHLRWKRHKNGESVSPLAASDVPRTSRSLARETAESPSGGLGDPPPRETRQSSTVLERGSRLEVERERLAAILARPQVEPSLFDTPDRLLSQLSRKVISPLMARVQEAMTFSDGLKSLRPPPLPRLPRPPWPF